MWSPSTERLFGGLASALNSAGLGGKVTIASGFGDVRNQSAILNGQEGVTTSDPNEIMGWFSVDAALRQMEKMSYPSGYRTPLMQLLAKRNSAMWKVANDFQVPANFAGLFKRSGTSRVAESTGMRDDPAAAWPVSAAAHRAPASIVPADPATP